MALKQYVTDEKDYLVSLRRYFHAHPEVSLKEYNTCKKIEEELDKIGLLHKRVGETGVYAWIDGEKGEGKTIALRADMDALAMEDLKTEEYRSQNEGFCHACGHDGHTATLLTAAKILNAKKVNLQDISGCSFSRRRRSGRGPDSL